MIVNNTIEASTIAPTPNATAKTTGTTPASFPSTLNRPARRPRVSDRPITKRTLGPGMTMMTKLASTKATMVLTETTLHGRRLRHASASGDREKYHWAMSAFSSWINDRVVGRIRKRGGELMGTPLLV